MFGFTKKEAVSHKPKEHVMVLQRAPSGDARFQLKITYTEP